MSLLGPGLRDYLEGSMSNWNTTVQDITDVLTVNPQNYADGSIYAVATTITGSLQTIGSSLVVLFFLIGLVKQGIDFREIRSSGTILRYFFRVVIANVLVTESTKFLGYGFKVGIDIINGVANAGDGGLKDMAKVPEQLAKKIESTGFIEAIISYIPAFLIVMAVLIFGILIFVTVFQRVFKVYMYIAIAPIPLATFASPETSRTASAFVRSFMGVMLEGAVIVIAFRVFTAFMTTDGASFYTYNDDNNTITEIFLWGVSVLVNLFILFGIIKSSDRITKEIIGM